MAERLELKAYGKINLGLDVVRKREDGYHEVRMIMQTVGVHDTIRMETGGQGLSVETNLPMCRTARGTWRSGRRSF